MKFTDLYTPEITKEIEEQWFWVYEYLSLKELIKTVEKDYLDIIILIHIPFFIGTFIFFFIAIPFGVLFLLCVYGIIFILLLLRLLYRTYYYLQGKNVIFTKKWILLGKHMLFIDQYDELPPIIQTYDTLFFELLGKKNRIQETIAQKRKQFMELFQKTFHFMGKTIDSIEIQDARVLAVVGIVLFVYSASLYICYLWGIIVWYIFFFVYALCIHLYTTFVKTDIDVIKERTERLHFLFRSLKTITTEVKTEIQSFQTWEITKLSSIIERKMHAFPHILQSIIKEKTHLLKDLETIQKSNFIDFQKVNEYIMHQYNTPILAMIELLKELQNKLDTFIQEHDRENIDSTDTGNIKLKITILQKNKETIESSIETLHRMLLSS